LMTECRAAQQAQRHDAGGNGKKWYRYEVLRKLGA
jgi:hypothetical protein